MNCGECSFYAPVVGAPEPVGQCHGFPPVVMLLPVPASPKADLLALGRGRGSGQMASLQSVRSVVSADSHDCSLFRPVNSH